MTAPSLRPYQRAGAAWLSARSSGILGDAMGLGKTAQAATAAAALGPDARILWVAPAATLPGLRAELPRWGLPPPRGPGDREDRAERAPKPKTRRRKGLQSESANRAERTERAEGADRRERAKRDCGLSVASEAGPSGAARGASAAQARPSWLDARVVAVSVDSVARHLEALGGVGWDVLVLDEAHTVKNPSASRSKAVWALRLVAKRCWMLTGTPMPSRPIELQPLLRNGCGAEWAERWRYGLRYCRHRNRHVRNGFDFSGALNLEELRERVAPYILARRPEDVPGELPPLTRCLVPLGCGRDAPAPVGFSRDSVRRYIEAKGAAPFDQLATYRRELGERKVEPALAYIQALIDGGAAPVVFAWHQSVVNGLANRLRVEGLTGALTPAERQMKVDLFASGHGDAIICSIPACGVGINGLHRRSGVAVFVESPWTPGEIAQAEGRVRRIGGVADRVLSYHLAAEDTLEAYILHTVMKKMDVQDAVLCGEDAEKTEKAVDSLLS